MKNLNSADASSDSSATSFLKLKNSNIPIASINFISFIGIPSIDNIIIRMNPELAKISKEEIEIISIKIKSFLFGNDSQIEEIIDNENINENIIEYIQGLKIIIIDEDIEDIQGLDDYITSEIKKIPSSICDII